MKILILQRPSSRHQRPSFQLCTRASSENIFYWCLVIKRLFHLGRLCRFLIMLAFQIQLQCIFHSIEIHSIKITNAMWTPTPLHLPPLKLTIFRIFYCSMTATSISVDETSSRTAMAARGVKHFTQVSILSRSMHIKFVGTCDVFSFRNFRTNFATFFCKFYFEIASGDNQLKFHDKKLWCSCVNTEVTSKLCSVKQTSTSKLSWGRKLSKVNSAAENSS